jgi:hypothetical protein
MPVAFICPRGEPTSTRIRGRSVSDGHPSSSLITATEAGTSQEINERTETFTAGLPVIRAQSDGSLHSPVLWRGASLAV